MRRKRPGFSCTRDKSAQYPFGRSMQKLKGKAGNVAPLSNVNFDSQKGFALVSGKLANDDDDDRQSSQPSPCSISLTLQPLLASQKAKQHQRLVFQPRAMTSQQMVRSPSCWSGPLHPHLRLWVTPHTTVATGPGPPAPWTGATSRRPKRRKKRLEPGRRQHQLN